MNHDLQKFAQTGMEVSPIIQSLTTQLPKMLGAVLCSADGFNICSIGLDDVNVGKMASLTSSLHSIGAAVVDTMSENVTAIDIKQKKEILLTIDSFQVAIVEVERAHNDNLVLLVAVDKTATGIVFMVIRKIVDILEKKLKNMAV